MPGAVDRGGTVRRVCRHLCTHPYICIVEHNCWAGSGGNHRLSLTAVGWGPGSIGVEWTA